jgi:ABC-type multidrug transport system fused ATPase/permease subunit
MKIIERYRSSIISKSLDLLEKKEKSKLAATFLIQIFLAFLDLIGVAIIGLLGALSINGVQSRPPGERVSAALRFFDLSDSTFQTQVAFLGIISCSILVFRTLISIYLIRKSLFFLSRRSAIVSSQLMNRLMSQSLLFIQKKSLQENLYSVTTGVTNLVLGVIGSLITLFADLVLLIVLFTGLLIVDAGMAFGSILFFVFVGFSLYWLLNAKAKKFGVAESLLNVESNEKIVEVLTSYRESIVRNRRSYYANEVGQIRLKLANTSAEISILPYISKYVIETSMVVGALLISAYQFVTQDATRAVSTLAVFLIAATRIAPAVLRIQQSAVQMKVSIGAANPTLNLINDLSTLNSLDLVIDNLDLDHIGFIPEVRLHSVNFSYPNRDEPSIVNASLHLKSGQMLAIVGPSGSGKTTLADLILGILIPDSGIAEVSNLKASEVGRKWPGALSYVPQDVMIANGSIKSNVHLGYPESSETTKLIWDALETAQLSDFVKSLDFQEDSSVGDRGSKLSGGQRQRLGIARALYSKPKLLVLDEATSALDGETEDNISTAINRLRGNVTIIVIAHRLSTIREADQVVYLESGRILASGTITEVRSMVPNFDRQAGLMGL